MRWPIRAVTIVSALLTFVTVAFADQWDDRTTLKFDAPMLIPGATLPPGTYTFQLLDMAASRHIVQIRNEATGKVMATVQTVPVKRMDAKGDVVVKLNPTDASDTTTAAIKAWYYPGSLYGHEFIYPEEQARTIAQRSKTLVLSGEVADSDMGKATLYTYDANGARQEWDNADQIVREWNEWTRRGRSASASVAANTEPKQKSTAPAYRTEPRGKAVPLSDLEEHADRYLGTTVEVTAEVEDVFGPRLFKIDEPNWADLDGEILVYLPSDLAALVRRDDMVTVTGTVKRFAKAELETDLGWVRSQPDLGEAFTRRPILVANRIVGGGEDTALVISVASPRATPTADTASTSRRKPLTDPAAVAGATADMVGRSVDLDRIAVERRAAHNGFWIEAGEESVLVIPARVSEDGTMASAGRNVSIDGVILEMPRGLRNQSPEGADQRNDEIYILATDVR